MSIDFLEKLLAEREPDFKQDRVGRGVSRDEDRRLLKNMQHTLMLLQGLMAKAEMDGGSKTGEEIGTLYLNILTMLDILEERNSRVVGNAYGEVI